MSIQYYNIHTHSPVAQPHVLAIDSLYFQQSAAPTSNWISVGFHPWHVGKIDLNEACHWLTDLAAQKQTVAIGEAGLDKVVEVDWERQLIAFQHCIRISEEYRKPLIIHCVRAYNEIIALKKKSKAVQPWIFHGFGKSPEAANMALKAGCYLSFGSGLVRENSHAPSALRHTPPDRYFLENDISGIPIESIYAHAAEILGKDVAELQAQVAKNVKSVFEIGVD
jgi:TatD DNase family protein